MFIDYIGQWLMGVCSGIAAVYITILLIYHIFKIWKKRKSDQNNLSKKAISDETRHCYDIIFGYTSFHVYTILSLVLSCALCYDTLFRYIFADRVQNCQFAIVIAGILLSHRLCVT